MKALFDGKIKITVENTGYHFFYKFSVTRQIPEGYVNESTSFQFKDQSGNLFEGDVLFIDTTTYILAKDGSFEVKISLKPCMPISLFSENEMLKWKLRMQNSNFEILRVNE